MGIQIKDSQKPGRNELCPCGSGLKYKYCHGDQIKVVLCNQAANEKMAELIYEGKIRKGLLCKHGVPINEHCPSCKIGD